MAKETMTGRLGEIRLPADLLAEVDAWIVKRKSSRAAYVRDALARQIAADRRLERRAAATSQEIVGKISGSGA